MGRAHWPPKDIPRVPRKPANSKVPPLPPRLLQQLFSPPPATPSRDPTPGTSALSQHPKATSPCPAAPPQQPEETSRRREACRPRRHLQSPLSAARAQATRRRRAQGPVPSPVRSLALRLPQSKPEHLSLGLGPGGRPRPAAATGSEELKHRERAEPALVTLPATEHLTSLPTFGALFNSRINSLRRRRKEPRGTRRCPESCPAGVARALLGFVVPATVAPFTSMTL